MEPKVSGQERVSTSGQISFFHPLSQAVISWFFTRGRFFGIRGIPWTPIAGTIEDYLIGAVAEPINRGSA